MKASSSWVLVRKPAAVERGQDAGLAAALRVGQRGVGLMAVEMQRAAAVQIERRIGREIDGRRGSARWRACHPSA